MQNLVEGGKELSPYLQWQKDMREQDLQEELAKIDRKHLEGRISHEEAAAARVRLMERNRETAKLTKEETAELMRKYAEQRLQEEKEMRELVQQVADGHRNSKIAKEKLHKFKQDIVKEFSKQNQELLRQALEEAQAELIKKFEIIQEVRAHLKARNQEPLPCNRAGHLEDTEVPQGPAQGSLALQKEQQQKEQQQQLLALRKEKQQKEQQLREAMENIELHRKVNAKAAAVRKEEEQKRKLAIRQRADEDETNLALRKKLEENRQERERLKQSVALSQTSPTPAVSSTAPLVTVTPVIFSSTTPGCSAFNTSTCEPCAPGSQFDNTYKNLLRRVSSAVPRVPFVPPEFHLMCTVCAGNFLQSPDVSPIRCPSDAFCPEGSLAPSYCMETFFRKAGDTCEFAPVTIALLVIGSGLTLLFIVLIVLRRRRDADRELSVARAPLLHKERPQGRYYGVPCDAEPVYAGW
ncbi:unnamed protein product [Tetraodon nigroviridis]|uniref:(spotted green pufferfish) hypothetical protein n=1 Tax=Tetraodon nigroviridis TaxID=99883 RepID=Q4RM22_TETNG|nr:unnamed protein product [Tetraodon nigroviridis]